MHASMNKLENTYLYQLYQDPGYINVVVRALAKFGLPRMSLTIGKNILKLFQLCNIYLYFQLNCQIDRTNLETNIMIDEDSKCKQPSFKMREIEELTGTSLPYSKGLCVAVQQDSRLQNCSMLPFYGLQNGEIKIYF